MENNLAGIVFFEGDNGIPQIRVNASDAFKAMSPIERAVYFSSAAQLAMICLQSLIHDNPADADMIRDMVASSTIEPVETPVLN